MSNLLEVSQCVVPILAQSHPQRMQEFEHLLFQAFQGA